MMSEKLHKAMNEQINAEMYSAYLYLSMASWLEDENLSGMAIWMKAQAQEEMEHAMKFYEFINDRRQKVDLLSIEGPKTSWNSPEEVFKESLEHEQYVTARINALMDMAREGKELCSRSLSSVVYYGAGRGRGRSGCHSFENATHGRCEACHVHAGSGAWSAESLRKRLKI